MSVDGEPVSYKVWSEPLIPLRVPLIEDMRANPFERAESAVEGYVEYPPRQKPGSFSLDQVLQKVQEGNIGKHRHRGKFQGDSRGRADSPTARPDIFGSRRDHHCG